MAAPETLPEGRAPDPPSRSRLLLMTGGAVVVGVLIVFGAVLPAEFDKDPTGLGKATGLSRLWAPAEVKLAPTAGTQPLARDYPTPYRSDVVDIRLDTGDTGGVNELEYKLRMKKGAAYVYSWTVEGLTNPDEFYYDFHGQTLPTKAGENITVATYKQATGLKSNGSLVAPFDGVHGWYLQNQSAKPVVVHLRVAGFYELVAGGQEGNLAGIQPTRSDAPAR